MSSRAVASRAVVRPALTVTVTGLPTAVADAAHVLVTGPNGFRRWLISGTLSRLRVGTYVVTATLVRSGATLYRAATRVQTVVLRAGSHAVLAVRYRAPTPPPPPKPHDGATRYDLGNPVLTDIWVDPVRGSDAATGLDRAHALRTVDAAWARVPASRTLTRGVRIQLVAGRYPQANTPVYWEHRWGTAAAPVVVNAADGAHTVRFDGDINAFDVRHFAVIGIDIIRNGDPFHCERCSYVLLRRVHLSAGRAAQETLKANQSDHLYVEDSELEQAYQNNLDYVAVQYGHVVGSKLHGAGDWCAYVKGGSAYLTFSDNEFYDCDTGGFSAGQGTGFQYMVAPWLHYESYGIRVVNNVVHDTIGAGLGVNGSYNVLMAYNTLYRVGTRSHLVEFVLGARGCVGAASACAARLALGGWGTTGEGGQWIPNRHVWFLNNVVVNPASVSSAWSQFAVGAVTVPPAGSNVPSPARADDDLVIAGNVIVNGGPGMDLGFGDGACGAANPTCNATLVLARNRINAIPATFVDAARLNLRPAPGSALAAARAVPVPNFGWGDRPARPLVPAGPTVNAVPRTHDGRARVGWDRPGAY